jgi:hypothetical protein
MLFRRFGTGSVHRLNFSLAALYLATVWIGLDLGGRPALPHALGGALLIAVFAWYGNLRRYRVIADHPTHRIASAPQGYVELAGQASDADGFALVAPLSGMPCIWFRYLLERRQGDSWVRSDAGESTDLMLLTDASGRCLVDPEGAEVHSSHYRRWGDGQTRKQEWIIQAGDPLYVIGEHATLGGANTDLDFRADLAALLNAWKADKADLLHRFDANRDGEVDLGEWQQARTAAEAQVARDHLEIRTRDGFHLLRRPGHGRLYLIANLPPAKLAQRYRWWSWAHLLACLAGGGAALALGL